MEDMGPRKWVPRAVYRLGKRKASSILLGIMTTALFVNLTGLHVHPFEIDFETNFSYPLDLRDLRGVVERRKEGLPVNDVLPINEYNYRLIVKNGDKCRREEAAKSAKKEKEPGFEEVLILFMIKSALSHRKRRDAIRISWGREGRFSDVTLKRIFVLGSCQSVDEKQVEEMSVRPVMSSGTEAVKISCQELVDEESAANGDIVQADFIDTYYNNTIKTMVSMKWVVNYCPSAQFTLFVDDDYYVSTKNLLRFVRNPLRSSSVGSGHQTPGGPRGRMPFDGRLYSGYVFDSSSPMRHKTSKWFVSLAEYPFAKYPPYVTAGAFVLSNEALTDMYYTSLYTKHFRFDDIYVGLLAKRASIAPHHNGNFYFYPPADFVHVIASHGFSDSQQMLRLWDKQRSLGNA